MTKMGQEIKAGIQARPVKLPPPRPQRSTHVLDLRQQTSRNAAPGFHEQLSSVPSAAPATEVPRVNAPVTPKQQPHRKLSLKQLAVRALKVLIVLAGAVGFFALNVSLPERLIGIYFVLAIVYAIDSQRTFLVALIFLVMVAVWSALGNSISAEDFAVYAFYFLVIGLVSAIREIMYDHHKPEPEHAAAPQ